MTWKKEIEYRVVWGDDEHRDTDIHFLQGSEWRVARRIAEECKQGLHDDYDEAGRRIQWVERVTRHYTEDDLRDEWEPALYSRRQAWLEKEE